MATSIAAAPAPVERLYPLRFHATGSEYFRIWIVNLLLTLVSFGLYYPFAKVRKLRYFYGNTEVAGHALDFHGDPWRMLRGYLLVGALFGLYSLASHVSALASLVGFVALAALWPALLRTSLRFRLANTSWRALRFRFAGDTGGAYKAMLPLFVPALLFVAASALQGEPEVQAAAPDAVAGGALLLAGLVAMLGMPLFWWMLKRYQHDHYQLAAVRTRLDAGPGAFYWLFVKGTALMLLIGVAAGLALALLAPGRPEPSALLFVASALLGYAAMLIVIYPYFTSRTQNLLWSRTVSRSLGFESDLRFWPLLGLALKNWLLILVTFGLYWPFAAVAVARMRLEAVTLVARIDLDSLAARLRDGMRDASGDAAGDLFGIDVGL